jgi:hypothetical protein
MHLRVAKTSELFLTNHFPSKPRAAIHLNTVIGRGYQKHFLFLKWGGLSYSVLCTDVCRRTGKGFLNHNVKTIATDQLQSTQLTYL